MYMKMIIIISIVVFHTGCVNLQKSNPAKNYFSLETVREGAPVESTKQTVLKVHRLNISPQFQGTEFVYRVDKLNYKSDYYNQYFTSPQSLVTEAVKGWMSDSGLFKNVVGKSSIIESTHELEGSVSALYGDFQKGSSPQAVMCIQFWLIGRCEDGPKVIFQSTYQKNVEIRDNSAPALADGISRALADILIELESHLAEKLL